MEEASGKMERGRFVVKWIVYVGVRQAKYCINCTVENVLFITVHKRLINVK